MQPVSGVLPTRGRGRGPWKEGQEFTELRRPRTIPPAVGSKSGTGSSTSTTTTSDLGAQGDTVMSSGTSRLSADAKEFVPKYYCAEQFEEAGAGGDAQSSGVYAVPDHLTENFLSDIVHDLTLNPGHFNNTIGFLTDLLLKDVGDTIIFQRVINSIVEKSIIFPNFRYNGARLLCHFRDALPNNLQHDFRNILLRKCQEENMEIMKNVATNSQQTQGFALFLAELFIQMDVTPGGSQRIAILGTALYEVLKALLSVEICENFKCVCQVLKLTGLALDEQDTRTMDAVFERLAEIKETYEKQNTVELIKTVIKLRHNAWRPPGFLLPEVPVINSEKQDASPFCLSNGDTLSPEETRFLQDNILPSEDYDEEEAFGNAELTNFEGEDAVDDEFDEAFEAFLAFSNQTKKS